MTQRLHVIPALGSGWAVRRPGASRASKRFRRRTDAILWAKARARETVVHRADGRVAWIDNEIETDGQDTHTYTM